MLLSAANNDKLVLWDAETLVEVRRYLYPNVISIAWHPRQNLVSFVTADGELFIYDEFLPPELVGKLSAPLHHRSLARHPRRGTPDSLDSILGPAEEDEDFVSDDDGAGYTNGLKRGNEHLERIDYRIPPGTYQTSCHPPFQPGSTPLRGDRRYLCVNLVGFVWTVNQTTHHTVSVEFNDHEMQRNFHFTDHDDCDKAALTSHGLALSKKANEDVRSMISYRPHETWTNRTDWRVHLPHGEDVITLALSDSFIVVTTSQQYVRIFTLCGTPYRVHRAKSVPTIACAAWRDYVMVIGNGPRAGDGLNRVQYTIENVKRDEVCQSDDVVALPPYDTLQTVFFSDTGDPCIYDSKGVLLVLQHWRNPGQARWVPILDTKQLERLVGGRKRETYWPVAVADGKFHCIILKGEDKYPYFPRPLVTEFDLQIPLTSYENADSARLEEQFVQGSLRHSLLADLLAVTRGTHSQRVELARQEIEIDKTLLQLLGIECREGEERSMKALELAQLLRDPSGKMVEAAAKVATRFDRTLLAEKIIQLGEQRLLGNEVDP